MVDAIRIKCIPLLLILVGASFLVAEGQRSDEYEVYDAVIMHMFKGGITRFDMNAKVERIVIRDVTYSDYASHPDKEDWDQVKTRLPSLTEETIAAYEKVRQNESHLKVDLDIPFEYALISDQQLIDIFGNTSNLHSTETTWKKFYDVYPRSAGFNSLSRVGFDKAKSQALVYFVNWCRPLCGTGSYLLLERAPDGWAVKESAGIWIS
jgi:hypothetical protein